MSCVGLENTEGVLKVKLPLEGTRKGRCGGFWAPRNRCKNEEQAGLDYKVSPKTSPVPSTPGLLSIPDPQRCDPMEDRSDDLKGCFVKIKVMHPYTLFLKS